MFEFTRCYKCGTKKSLVSLSSIEILGERKTVWLCEKCYNKYALPIEKKSNVNDKN